MGKWRGVKKHLSLFHTNRKQGKCTSAFHCCPPLVIKHRQGSSKLHANIILRLKHKRCVPNRFHAQPNIHTPTHTQTTHRTTKSLTHTHTQKRINNKYKTNHIHWKGNTKLWHTSNATMTTPTVCLPTHDHWGDSVGRASDKRSKNWRFEPQPRQKHKKQFWQVFPSQKSCSDSSVCPTPVCIRIRMIMYSC